MALLVTSEPDWRPPRPEIEPTVKTVKSVTALVKLARSYVPLASAPPLIAEMETEPTPPLAVRVPMFMTDAEAPRSMLRNWRVERSPAIVPRTRLVIARLPETPLPAWTVPPLATLTVPRSVPEPPRMALLATLAVTFVPALPPKDSVPPLTLTATVPVRSLVGPMVKAPLPDLMSLLVPEPSTEPPKALFAPTVSSPLSPRRTAPPVAPAPSRVAMDCVVPLRSSWAPATLAKRMTELAERLPFAPALIVPPLSAVSIA